MARFVSFDGKKTFYNIGQIFSVEDVHTPTSPFASQWANLAYLGNIGSCKVTFLNGGSILIDMSAAQAHFLIASAEETTETMPAL